VPAGAYKNREFRECMVDISPSVKHAVLDIMYDPQTSGGLLICVEKESAGDLVNELKEKGVDDAAVIGEVLSEPKERIVVS
jgi:selenide,water dikinase